MKADKAKMFSVPLKSFRAEDGLPFPLYILLRRNERFVPVCMPGDPIGVEKYQQLGRTVEELWVPVTFQDAYNTYLQYLANLEHPEKQAAKSNDVIEAGASRAPKEEFQEKSEEADLVHDVLEDEELDSADKVRILSAVSQDLLRSLNQITTRGEAARANGMHRCKEIADEVLLVASQKNSMYDEILALRNSQEELEHSVIVGTISVMFATAIGFTDEVLLSDLALAAIFHDIGMVRLKADVLAKKESEWTEEERAEYETHVIASVETMKVSGMEFDPRVLRMIQEHHENYDGTGFPDGRKGGEISDLSQIVHMANLFDRLCTGKQTGVEQSPAEAFEYMRNMLLTPNSPQEVRPELLEGVLQFLHKSQA